ncbi:MAG: 3-deoxy-manno-octulosonate cytidylyltransferase [Flavobacteriaceae bacterium]|nr:3-deoxy-manno-octulosonate cytidylyltransferase [Flavobacteriaceae bacterium]
MKIIAMIPARYQASRFPGKLMQDLGGKPVIVRTYQAAVNTQLFDAVYVVTDSLLIFDTITAQGGKAIMSKKEHHSGSDRIAEAVADRDVDVVVNVQGDEPFTKAATLAALLEVFKNDTENKIALASLMTPLTDKQEIDNPNNVKVTVDGAGFALNFSRKPIASKHKAQETYYKHIGIYAFRKEALIQFTHLPMAPLEKEERLENLRFIHYNMPIKMIETQYNPIGIDTPEDLENAKKLLDN